MNFTQHVNYRAEYTIVVEGASCSDVVGVRHRLPNSTMIV
jgi:hypothetical protein